MKTRRLIAVLVAALALVNDRWGGTARGASTAAADAGASAYRDGELQSTQPVSLDRAWDASQEALREMEFPLLTKTRDDAEGLLTARTTSDKRVQIKFRKVAEHTTRISVRVGLSGDELLSRTILRKIRSHF
jgi:hypothetical protein